MVTVGVAHAHTFETNSPMPRVNAQQAAQSVGRRVLLVGRVLDGGLTVQTADDGVISVMVGKNGTGESGPMMAGKVVEICGVMDSHNSITEESRTYFGDSFGACTFRITRHQTRDIYPSPSFTLFVSSLSRSSSTCSLTRADTHTDTSEHAAY